MYAAFGPLCHCSAQTIAFVQARLFPVPAEKPQRIRALIADLDSRSLAERKAASEELARLGLQAEGALREALDEKPSLEMSCRIRALLDDMHKPIKDDPETLRAIRGIWILERIGTPNARKLLEDLAAGVPEARQTQHAKAALQRLQRKP